MCFAFECGRARHLKELLVKREGKQDNSTSANASILIPLTQILSMREINFTLEALRNPRSDDIISLPATLAADRAIKRRGLITFIKLYLATDCYWLGVRVSSSRRFQNQNKTYLRKHLRSVCQSDRSSQIQDGGPRVRPGGRILSNGHGEI